MPLTGERKREYQRNYMRGRSKKGLNLDPSKTPQAIDCEQKILACCLKSPEALVTAAEKLSPGEFYRQDFALVYEVMLNLYQNGQHVDLVTVITELRKRVNDPEAIISAVSALADLDAFPAAIESYLQPVKEAATARRILGKIELLRAKIYGHEYEDASELTNEFQSMALDAAELNEKKRLVSMREALLEFQNELDRRYRGETSAISTGLKDLDTALGGGLLPGDLILIGARPSHGKTSLVTGIALHVAEGGGVVVVFATESTATRLTQKLVSQTALIDNYRLKMPAKMEENDWRRLTEAAAKLDRLEIFINDTPKPTVAQIRSDCLKVKAKNGRLDLVVVDYIQRVEAPGKQESRYEELSRISSELKTIAQETRCPLIVTSQLNRGVESRQDKRPNMADLRDCGRLEEEADVAILLYRPERYKPDDRPGEVEVIIEKSREGETGSFWAVFQKEYTIFRDKAGNVVDFPASKRRVPSVKDVEELFSDPF